MLEERNEAIREIEREMEDEYDYSTMKTEAVSLKFAIEEFMLKKDRKKLEMNGFRWQVIRPVNRIWNAAILEAKLGTRKFLMVTKTEVDPDKLDEQVRKGNIDLSDIEDALEEFPKKPYIKRYESSEADADEEAEKVREAMEPSKRKGKRKSKAALR